MLLGTIAGCFDNENFTALLLMILHVNLALFFVHELSTRKRVQ